MIFKVLSNFEDLEELSISGLATERIERGQLENESLNIKIEYEINKPFSQKILAQKIQNINVGLKYDEIMYQNDDLPDTISAHLNNFNLKVKTFWENEDKLIFHIPKKSAGKWKNIEEFKSNLK